MLDLDLDQQLRDEFRSTADRVEPSARLDGLVRDRLARRQMQRRLTFGGGAALALALIVGVTAALSGNAPDSVVMSPTDSDTDGSAGVHADANADGDLDADAGANVDADVTPSLTVPPDPNPTTSLLPPVDGIPAVPGAEAVTGTFAGALSKIPSPLPDPGCQVEATFDPMLTLADGTAWHLRTDYCVAGVGSAGAGNFVLALPNGESVTGSIGVQATGTGVALLTIDGGSGAYADASGSCQLDGWGTDLTTLGTFQQQGSFSCSIAGVASH